MSSCRHETKAGSGHTETLAKLDTDWAISEIDRFLHVTDQIHPDMGPGIAYFGTVMSAQRPRHRSGRTFVEQILDRVLPGWSRDRPEKDRSFRDCAIRRPVGAALGRQAEVAEKLGDDAPHMDAANLHLWAWENGRSYWNAGHYRRAAI